MKIFLSIIAALILVVIVFGWIFINMYVSLFPSDKGCHILGMGGISHVPANCVKYFLK